MGLQFDELFTNGLYPELGHHAVNQAQRIRENLEAKAYHQHITSQTNQFFVVLENNQIKQLDQQASMDFWEKYDDTHTVMRLATSWATQPEDVDALLALF